MAKSKLPKLPKGGLVGAIVTFAGVGAVALYDRYMLYRAQKRRMSELDKAQELIEKKGFTTPPTDQLITEIQEGLKDEESRKLLAQRLSVPCVNMMDHFDTISQDQPKAWQIVNVYDLKRHDWPGHLFGVTTRAPFRLGAQAPSLAQWLIGIALMFPGGGGQLDGETHAQIDKRWRENSPLSAIRGDLLTARPRIRKHTITSLLSGPALDLAPIMLGYTSMITLTPLPEVKIPGGTLLLGVAMTTGCHVLDGIAVWGIAVRDGVPYWVSLHVGKHPVSKGVDALNLPFAASVFHTSFHLFGSLACRWQEARARLEGTSGSPLLREIVEPSTTAVEGGYTPEDVYNLVSDNHTTGNVDKDFGWLLANMRDAQGANLTSWKSTDGKPIPQRERKEEYDDDLPPDL